MESKTKLIMGIMLTLAVSTSGTYYLADEDTAYYCASRDLVMLCESLSSGSGTRCYYEETYKVCKEGWNEIQIGQEILPQTTDGFKWECSPSDCVRI